MNQNGINPGEKIIYSHGERNSMCELISKPGLSDENNAPYTGKLSEKLYSDAIRRLNAFPFEVTDFWKEFGDDADDMGSTKKMETKK